MQIYLSLMSQKNPSSDSSSYDLSSPQGRMLYVRETTNAAFSSWTSPLQRQDPDTQEEKKQEISQDYSTLRNELAQLLHITISCVEVKQKSR